MAFDAQRKIRENTLELQEFLKDLKQWETRVKEKDRNIKSQAQDNVPGVPPVRGSKEKVRRCDVSHKEPKGGFKPSQTGSIDLKTKAPSEDERKPATAAKHTYDYFRDKWDKFDVDAALKAVDGEDTSGSSNVLEENKKKKVQSSPQYINHDRGAVPASDPQETQKLSAKRDNINNIPSALKSSSLDSFVDATSEKELGNKFFKEKKFVQAIECYSRSIALQPSAVAYANRAMAYIKIRRFKEAELDCTEAIALDDRYIKAYSRRGTTRKELGNYLGAVADAEFALRLEPENKELKEQYMDAKALCEKTISTTKHGDKKVSVAIEEIKAQRDVYSQSGGNENAKEKAAVLLREQTPNKVSVPPPPPPRVQPKEEENEADLVMAQAMAASVAAARTAGHAVVVAPRTFYEFEAAWKSFSSNSAQQAELLKVIKPSSLPQLFKDNLSPKLLADMIRSLEQLFPQNVDHAVDVLENLTMAKRFNITAMCLTKKDKAELRKLWEDVFIGSQVDADKVRILSDLRPKFQL